MNPPIRKKKSKPLRPDDPDLVALFFTALFWGLEERKKKPQAARVRHILNLLGHLQGSLNADSFPAFSQLRDALSRYSWGGQIMYSKRGFRSIFMADRKRLTEDDIWEHGMVSELLKLVEYPGVMSRIRRCKDEDCQELFFAAKRSDQEFHLKKCRQHFYDSDEGTRAKKRKYMRKYYKDGKDRARNPKSGIGLRERNTSRSRGRAK